MRQIPIFFTFNDQYVKPAAVAFWSLLDRTRDGVFWEMWVLHHDIAAENQMLLSGIAERSGRGTVKFVDTGDFLAGEWASGSWEGHQARNKFTADTIIRCFGSRFFPQYEKIIYSDVDVVFADDISGLWEIDVSEVYLAGVKDAFLKHNPEELSHLSATHFEMLKDCYLAGGIWVMNLAKIRQDGKESRMMEIVRDDAIVKRWNDQDVVNIAFEGKVGFLPLNYIAYPYLLSRMQEPGFASHYSREELFDSVIHPKIIHYAGRKPWSSSGVGYDEQWWAIADYLKLGCSRPSGLSADEGQRLQKKVRLYRKRLICAVVFSVILIVIMVFVALA